MRIPIKINLARIKHGAKFKGIFEIEVKDKLGNLISRSRAENRVVDESLNRTLDVMFHGTTQITSWYCVISETNTSPAAGMTYATPQFTEWQSYSEATRPEFNEAASSNKSITNSANKAVFTANATKTLYGAGLVGGGSAPSTKGNTDGGGCLYDFGLFTASQPVVDGNVVNLTVTITSADDEA
jgi:hypothetical protein